MTCFGRIVAFCREERGATAIEYAMILALVFLALVGGAKHLANELDSMYNMISTNVQDSVN